MPNLKAVGWQSLGEMEKENFWKADGERKRQRHRDRDTGRGTSFLETETVVIGPGRWVSR